MSDRASKPTPEDEIAAARLRAIWLRVKELRRISQEDAAKALEITQPAVNQYLRGKIGLGFQMLMKWSQFLDVEPTSIRDDLPELRHVAQQTIDTKAQQRNHITAIQLVLASMTTALRVNTPVAARAFSEHLQKSAAALDFSDQSGLLARLTNIVGQDLQTMEDAAPHRKRQSRL